MKKQWIEMVQRASVGDLQNVHNGELSVDGLMDQLGIAIEEPIDRAEELVRLQEKVASQAQTVTYEDVAEAFAQSPLKRLGLRMLDGELRALPSKLWRRILDFSQVDAIEYVPEIMDCDKFARIFVGDVLKYFHVSAGLVVDISSKHAYVAILVYDNEQLSVVSIEPQNDGWAVAAEGDNPTYKADLGDVTL